MRRRFCAVLDLSIAVSSDSRRNDNIFHRDKLDAILMPTGDSSDASRYATILRPPAVKLHGMQRASSSARAALYFRGLQSSQETAAR